jgi:SPP1 gp7 family putative phage head morphogenesis protein
MQNYSDSETERRLSDLTKKITTQYGIAYRELAKKCKEYFRKFEERYQKEYEAYQNGAYTAAEFAAWVKAQIARGEHWNRLRDNVALRITKANETAASYINDTTPSIWTLNYNFTAYQADKAMGVSFDIYDENTVRRLIQEDPKLLPSISQKAIDRAKDTAWNRAQFTKDVTSAIMQGTPPSQLAKSLQHTMGLNQVSAIRNARTAITSAQNGGRMEGYTKLAAMGVEMQKEWIATLDNRTRDSHRDLDGERVAYNKTFSNGLMFPADPSGAGREVWNCRCTMRAIFPENNEPRKMTYYGQNAGTAYKEWKEESGGKRTGGAIDAARHTVIGLGKNNVGTIKRGKPMTHEEADSGNANPHRNEVGGEDNCQTCAVVYEARLRGYNLVAKVYNDNNRYMERLSYDMRLAFIDPITKKHPQFTYMPESVHGAEDYAIFLNKQIGKNERYSLDFGWKNSKEGHVVNVWRTQNGELQITDNQTGDNYVGDLEVIAYLKGLDYSLSKKNNPKLLRIDNMEFDYSFIKHIVEAAE